MKTVVDRIEAAVAEWRASIGSEPDTLCLGRREFAQLQKLDDERRTAGQESLLATSSVGIFYGNLRVLRQKQRLDQLTIERQAPLP